MKALKAILTATALLRQHNFYDITED